MACRYPTIGPAAATSIGRTRIFWKRNGTNQASHGRSCTTAGTTRNSRKRRADGIPTRSSTMFCRSSRAENRSLLAALLGPAPADAAPLRSVRCQRRLAAAGHPGGEPTALAGPAGPGAAGAAVRQDTAPPAAGPARPATRSARRWTLHPPSGRPWAWEFGFILGRLRCVPFTWPASHHRSRAGRFRLIWRGGGCRAPVPTRHDRGGLSGPIQSPGTGSQVHEPERAERLSGRPGCRSPVAKRAETQSSCPPLP